MYESSWKCWCSWCCTRKIDPVSASLKYILTFLSDTFNSGLQYRSIVLRSALSVTLPKIDSYSVGQHPYVVNILRGILNEQSPKPCYSQTWDVSTVTSYLVKMGNNSDISLKKLSWKLATILLSLAQSGFPSRHTLTLTIIGGYHWTELPLC